MIAEILLTISLTFTLIAILVSQGDIKFPIQKLGIPLFWNDVKWTMVHL